MKTANNNSKASEFSAYRSALRILYNAKFEASDSRRARTHLLHAIQYLQNSQIERNRSSYCADLSRRQDATRQDVACNARTRQDVAPVTRENAFSVMYDSKYGKTICVSNPKLESYKYIAMCLARYSSQIPGAYSTIFHEDNSVTVAIDGLMPITFESGN